MQSINTLMALTQDGGIVIHPMRLIYICLALVGIVALVFLILLLFRVIRLVKSLENLVDDLSEPLVEATKEVPILLHQGNLVMGNLVDMSDDLAEYTEPLLRNGLSMVSSIELLLASLSDTLTELSDLIGRMLGAIASVSDRVKTVGIGATSIAGKSVLKLLFKVLRANKNRRKAKKVKKAKNKKF